MFSLIVATVNRVAELERLLSSLDAQTCKDFEVIVIDQNDDDRLVSVLSGYSGLNVQHLRSEKGAGRARNAGLRIARGDFIAFPDDDCWYPPTLLADTARWFLAFSELDGLFPAMRDANNCPVGPRWLPHGAPVTKANLWSTTMCVTGFLRSTVTKSVGFFREDIGVGAATPYQSGEESDYFLRGLAMNFRMWYEPSLVVHHPNLHDIQRLRRTVYPYALGCGYVLRLHGYSWLSLGTFLARSLGGSLFSLAKGDLSNAQLYAMRAAGQLRGYLLGPRDITRYNAQPRQR